MSGAEKAIEKVAQAIPQVLPHMTESLQEDIGHSSDLDLKKNGVVHSLTNHTVPKDTVAERMMLTLAENRHLVFRGTSASACGKS